MSYRLGVDTGGTFTDVVLIDESSGRVANAKVPSTPRDPSEAFLQGVRLLLAQERVSAGAVATVVHGTTVATNALLEKNGARTGLVTTAGFRDVLEIRRHVRPQGRIYDLRFTPPEPLVPRELRTEVTERLDASGDVLVPLDEAELLARVRELAAAGVEAIAIAFLHAYRNGAHEERARALIARELPRCFVAVSSEISPEMREYERTSTTVVNAYLGPVVSRYLGALEGRLRAERFRAPLRIMQGNGGALSASRAAERPVHLVVSGPAGGAVGGMLVGRDAGFPDVITMDMGGTSCDLGLIERTPRLAQQKEVDGNPIRVPMIDLHVIGAGGGSLAWVDAGGALRVGPRSAGADPGPACYGRGGGGPTVTDADVVLGRLDPDYFLGGAMKLDRDAARAAVDERVARRFGLTVEAAAAGIVRVVNALMAENIKVVSVKRGHDPRDFALVAFGGAGPTHATALMSELQVAAVLVPSVPGTLSALGLIATDVRHDYVATYLRRLDTARAADVATIFEGLRGRGAADLREEGVAERDVSVSLVADVRYVGQAYEVSVPLSTIAGTERVPAIAPEAIAEAFHVEHERLYAHRVPDAAVEIVALRLAAFGRIPRPAPATVARGGARPEPTALKARRPVYFEEAGGFVDCPVWERSGLRAGNALDGPAIVEQMDTTTVLVPGQCATVHETGTLIVRRRP